MPKPWRMVRAEATPDVLELHLFGFVENTSFWGDGDGCSAADFARQLKDFRGSKIVVRINSMGGDAHAGIAMHSMLRSHGAAVETIVEGLAASAASIVAAAGRCKIARGAEILVHNPSTWGDGTAKDLRAAAERLDRTRAGMVGIYAGKTRQTPERIGELLDAETVMDCDEAIALGFADEIEGTSAPQAVGEQIIWNSVAFPASALPAGLVPRTTRGASAMNDKSLIAALKALMGLAEGATNEEVLTGYSKAVKGEDPKPAKKPEGEPAPAPAPSPSASAPAPVKAETTAAPALPAGELGQLCALTGKGTVLDALAEIIRLKTETVPRSAAPSQVQVALAERRIFPHEVDALKRMEGAAPDALRSYLVTRAINSCGPDLGREATPQASDAETTGDGPTAAHKAVGAVLGVDPAKVAAQRIRT